MLSPPVLEYYWTSWFLIGFVSILLDIIKSYYIIVSRSKAKMLSPPVVEYYWTSVQWSFTMASASHLNQFLFWYFAMDISIVFAFVIVFLYFFCTLSIVFGYFVWIHKYKGHQRAICRASLAYLLTLQALVQIILIVCDSDSRVKVISCCSACLKNTTIPTLNNQP